MEIKIFFKVFKIPEKIFKYLSKKISRLIYFLIPSEIKNHINKSSFNFINKKLNEEKDREVFEIFGTHLKKSIRFSDKKSIRKYAINLALAESFNKSYKEDLFYLEFGVFEGQSINYWRNLNSNLDSRFIGFDTFEGMPFPGKFDFKYDGRSAEDLYYQRSKSNDGWCR